jgi:hypothetical protein
MYCMPIRRELGTQVVDRDEQHIFAVGAVSHRPRAWRAAPQKQPSCASAFFLPLTPSGSFFFWGGEPALWQTMTALAVASCA